MGRTTHSRFKIPLTLSNNSVCNIKIQSATAELLRVAKIIIWNEALMAKRQEIAALDRTMQDITGQVLLVMRHDTQAHIVNSSLRMSPMWSSIKKLRLTINMRALTDPWFSDFLLRVSDGNEESIDENFIHIPDDMAIPYTNKNELKDALIDAIFPSLQTCETASDYIIYRAILTTKNEHVDEINDQLVERFCGEEKIYYSFDEAEDDKNNLYPIGFQQNAIDVEIVVGQHAGKRLYLQVVYLVAPPSFVVAPPPPAVDPPPRAIAPPPPSVGADFVPISL
ncbi:uncharacterized protein LOC112519920 [Cynara cardunculus var. scolymus]|uniref:uncharacterized protein LOC112519920 n=1 Tax=Cynara cardunculus var. scolymus TaxID=59895 RepID=UPI000D62EBF1|nr:uncharacterized protein LOC112519920 [Cynara cardunculus var. scolymus]